MKDYLKHIWQWLQSDVGVMVALIACLPLGMVLVWREVKLSTCHRQLLLGIGTVVCLFGIVFYMAHAQLQVAHANLVAQHAALQTRQAHTETMLSEKKASLRDLQTDSKAYHKEMQPYEKLAAAEGKKRQADADAAEKVSTALTALPLSANLVLADKEKVAAVRKSFDALSAAQKALVDEATLKADEQKITVLAAQAQKDAEAAKKKAEADAAAARQKAAEEARGYETGITYEQLARTPDPYEGKKIKFYGEVLQVMEDSGQVQVRLAVNGDYNNVILCEWYSSSVSSRVLEDDFITVSGTSAGLLTYESTMGGDITIPSMAVAKVDQ